ncbi:hypothetical protein VaNZ11_004917, partial [Volvox africanus]
EEEEDGGGARKAGQSQEVAPHPGNTRRLTDFEDSLHKEVHEEDGTASDGGTDDGADGGLSYQDETPHCGVQKPGDASLNENAASGPSTCTAAADTPTQKPPVHVPYTPLQDTNRVRPQQSTISSAVAVAKVAANAHGARLTTDEDSADVAVAEARTDLKPPPPLQPQPQPQPPDAPRERRPGHPEDARLGELRRQLVVEAARRRAAEAENAALREQLATAKEDVKAAFAQVDESKQRVKAAVRGAEGATAAVAAANAAFKGLQNQLLNVDQEKCAAEVEKQAVLQQLATANQRSARAEAAVQAMKKQVALSQGGERGGKGGITTQSDSGREWWSPQGGQETSAQRANKLHAALGSETIIELQSQLATAGGALRGLQNELTETRQELEAANVLKEHFYEQLVEAKQRLRDKKADVYRLAEVNEGLQRELAALASAAFAAARAEQKRRGGSSSSSSASGNSSSNNRWPRGGGSGGGNVDGRGSGNGGSDTTTSTATTATASTSLPSLASMIEAERERLSIRAFKAAYQAVLNIQRLNREDSSGAYPGGESAAMAGGLPRGGPVDGQRQQRVPYRSAHREVMHTSFVPRSHAAGGEPRYGASEDGGSQTFGDTLGRSTAPTMPRPRADGSGASTSSGPSAACLEAAGSSMGGLGNMGHGDRGAAARDSGQIGPKVAAEFSPHANFSIHAYGYGTSRSTTITAHFR